MPEPTSARADRARSPMLERWSATVDERTAIEQYLDWQTGREEPGVSRRALLDLYFEIDRAQLDRERRELLATTRAEDVQGV